MASFKVAIMSFLETAASIVEQFNPLWILPEWMRNLVMGTIRTVLALATVIALLLYRNQVAARLSAVSVACVISGCALKTRQGYDFAVSLARRIYIHTRSVIRAVISNTCAPLNLMPG